MNWHSLIVLLLSITAASASAQKIIIDVKVVEVVSYAEDKGAKTRHRMRFQAEAGDSPGELVCWGTATNSTGNLGNPNLILIENKELSIVPEDIGVMFQAWEEEDDADCEANSNDRLLTGSTFYLPLDFPEGEEKDIRIQLEEAGRKDFYQAVIRIKYSIPKPTPASGTFITSNSLNGKLETNFCEENALYLKTQDYTVYTDLKPDNFKYVWEYHFQGNNKTEFDCTVTRKDPNPSGCSTFELDYSDEERPSCGDQSYNPDCEDCDCESVQGDAYWHPIGESDEPSFVWNAARRNGYDQVAFRYRLKHITNGQAGPPSESTGYATIYDPPPTLNYTDNTEAHFDQASEATYDNGDLRIQHVACKGGTGQITIKNVTGDPGREYFYSLRGPVDNPEGTVATEAEGGFDWNINGQGKAAPQSDRPNTWLTFPDGDPSGSKALPAGTYWLVIENWDRRSANTNNTMENLDLRACYVAKKITVKEPAAVLTTGLTKKEYQGGVHVSCREHSDGEITLNATGGIAPYRYFLKEKDSSDPAVEQTQPTFTGLAALRGENPITYEYHVEDAMGCVTDEETFTLIAPERLKVAYAIPTHYYPDASTGPYHIQCFGSTDSASIKALGGVAPYTVRINDTDYTSDANGNQIIASSLSGDQDYPIRITDANGCVVNTTVRLNQPDSLILTQYAGTPPTCSGGDQGSIYLKAAQGIPLADGAYTYTIRHTDVPATYQAIFEAEQTHTDITALFENLIEGRYDITIQDRYACSYDTTIVLTAPPPLQIRSGTRPITCLGDEDGALWVAVSGGTPPYRLDYGPQSSRDTLRTVTNQTPHQYDSLFSLPSARYWVRVTDANGCRTQALLDVRSPRQALSLTVDTVQQVSPISCYGAHDGRVQLTAVGGWTERPYRYGHHLDSLHEGQQAFRGLGAGTYTFYVQDAQGCTDSVRVTLREPEPLEAAVVSVQNIRCHGQAEGSIDLNVKGGAPPYRVSLNQGMTWQSTTRLEELSAGSYELWVADQHDCQAAPLVVTLSEPSLLSSQVVSTQDTRCGLAEGSASVSVTGGVAPYQVTWVDEQGNQISDSFSASQLYAGSYTAQISDAHGCTNTLTATISDRDGPVVRLVDSQPVRCAGESNGSATIEITGGTAPLSIRWDDGQDQLQATDLSGGEHQVEVQDANGCRRFLTVPIGEPFPLEIITEQQVNPVCSGESNGQLRVIAQGGGGGYRYEWNTGASTRTLEELPVGTYTVTVTDGQGCQTQQTLSLTNPDAIVPTIPDTLLLCYGQQATLDAGYPGSTYAWESTIGERSQNQTMRVEHPGTYQVTVTNEQGCQGTKSTEVIYSNELLKAEFLMMSEAQTGDTVVLVDVSWPTPESTSWTYDSAHRLTNYDVYQELIFDQPGTYEVTMRAWVGECQDEITKSITVTAAEVVAKNGRVASSDFIRSFQLLPNPSDGRFVAKVALREAAPIRLRLTDLNSKGTVLDIQKDQKATYEVPYDLAHLSAGVYLLTLQVGHELRTSRVIIR